VIFNSIHVTDGITNVRIPEPYYWRSDNVDLM